MAIAIQFSDYQKLIAKQAWKGHARLHAAGVFIDYEDVYQHMCETFCLAAQKFNEDRGFKFTTYLVTSIHRQFNRWVESMIENSKHVSSVEELEAGSEECNSLLEVIASNEPSPEEIYERKNAIEAALNKVSSRTQTVIRELIQPSAELTEFFEAKRAHQAHGRELNVSNRRIQAEINFGLVCDHLQYNRTARTNVRREINENFGIDI